MFITRRHLARRTFLRGAGATVALPLLDAMVPAATALADTAAKPATRLGYFYLPHGAIMNNTVHGAEMDHWTPVEEGREFTLKPILESLKPFQDQVTVVSGLGNRAAVSPSVHAITPGTWLSCVSPAQGLTPDMASTVDQLAAREIGQVTPFPSLEVAGEPGGPCDGTYGCSYGQTLSFRSATQPLPMEYNPRKLFVQLFGLGATPEERETMARRHASVLDLVSAQAQSLRGRLGAPDRGRLDDYLETVRELERRVEIMQAQGLAELDLPDMPVGVSDSYEEQLNLMFDLVALAFQVDLSRVVSYMMAVEVSNRTYNHIGVPDPFHPLSHHGNSVERLLRLVRIQQWHTEVFARFVERLANTPDGDGSLLDHSILLYGSNMSNSNYHDNFPLPTVVVGRGSGTVRGGQHLRYPDHTPLANLHLTLLQKAGVAIEQVGDSSGELAGV